MHELSKKIADYQSLRKTLSELEERLKSIEGDIKAYMGDTEEVMVDGHTIRWKRYTQSRFDTAAFRSQHSALYEQYTKQIEARRFTVT